MSENSTVQEVKKKHKIGKILAILIVLGVIAGGGYYGYTQYSVKQQAQVAQAKEIHYEVLDESVLSTDILKKWVAENKLTKGVNSTSDDNYTYILISGGKQNTTGYGIALEKINGEVKSISVQYKVIAPDNPNTIENKESYPNMVVRLPKDTRTIKEMIEK